MEYVSYEMVAEALRKQGRCCGIVDPTDYHAWKGKLSEEFGAPVVSKSSLCDFNASPYRWRYNELHHIRKEAAGLRMGSLVDCLTLTPSLYPKEYAVEEIDLRTKAGKERKAALEAEGRTLVKPEEDAQAREIALQATAHLEALGLTLGHTYYSQVGLWVYITELDGAPLDTPLIVTGMVDICPMDDCCGNDDALWDLKTTSKDPSDAQALFYAMEDFHYGVGAALYLDLFNLCTGENRTRFGHLFVGTTLPAMSRAVWLGAEIEVYRRDYKAMLRRFAYTAAADDWGEAELPEVVYQPTKREAFRFDKVMFGER